MSTNIEQVIAEALRGAGLSSRPDEFDSSIHSWRCAYPDRYGRCKCFEGTVTDLVAALRAANLLRESAVPDAATELRTERDAALAAIERVRAEARAYAKQPDVLEPCGAAAQSILAALDGAPEPEEKP